MPDFLSGSVWLNPTGSLCSYTFEFNQLITILQECPFKFDGRFVRFLTLLVINYFVKFPTADRIPRQISVKRRCFRQGSLDLQPIWLSQSKSIQDLPGFADVTLGVKELIAPPPASKDIIDMGAHGGRAVKQPCG
jgi:hypothetical protein